MKTNFRIAAAVAVLSLVGSQHLFAQTPIAYWTFNDAPGSTTLVDSSGNGYDATHQGGVTPEFTAGVLQGAWQGSGVDDDYFNTPAFSQLSGIEDVTISAWVRPDTTEGYYGILFARLADTNLGMNGNWGIAARSGGIIDHRVQGDGHNAPNGSAPDGVWTHVVSRYDSLLGESEIFINGASVGTDAAPSGISWNNSGTWLIGEDTCCGNREFDGAIDDLALFDTYLDDSAISDIYNDGIAGISLDGTANPQPGDVDGDGDVDQDDVDVILGNFLTDQSLRTAGDLTNDGFVGLADFRQWKDNNPFPGGGSAVPEPTSVALLSLLGVCGIGLRMRRS